MAIYKNNASLVKMMVDAGAIAHLCTPDKV